MGDAGGQSRIVRAIQWTTTTDVDGRSIPQQNSVIDKCYLATSRLAHLLSLASTHLGLVAKEDERFTPVGTSATKSFSSAAVAYAGEWRAGFADRPVPDDCIAMTHDNSILYDWRGAVSLALRD